MVANDVKLQTSLQGRNLKFTCRTAPRGQGLPCYGQVRLSPNILVCDAFRLDPPSHGARRQHYRCISDCYWKPVKSKLTTVVAPGPWKAAGARRRTGGPQDFG